MFGIRYIPVVVFALLFTDLIIGFHSTMIFTSGSIILIGLISKYFNKSIMFRISGAFVGAVIFFVLSNFGVWLGGSYGYDLNGLLSCYILAIPFFTNTVLSTVFFSILIELTWAIMMKRNIKKI